MADDERKLQRRISTYNVEMWEILHSATESKTWRKEFQRWNEVVNFRQRFYKFRMDVLEANVPGARRLIDVTVTGSDSLGARFTVHREGIGPYLMEWQYTGGEASSSEQRVQPPQRVLGKGEVFVPELDGFQAREQAASSAFDDVLEKWMQGGRAQPGSGNSSASSSSGCAHEWDATETRCLHCGEPKP